MGDEGELVERGHDAVIQETQAMLKGLLGDSLTSMQEEFTSGLQREAMLLAELTRVKEDSAARERSLVARVEHAERERREAQEERDKLLATAHGSIASIATTKKALDESRECEARLRQQVESIDAELSAATVELAQLRDREEQWQAKVEEAVAARLDAERKSGAATKRTDSTIRMYQDLLDKVAGAARQMQEQKQLMENETRRAGLAENHARASDERAAASERQRGDAQALAAEAVAERDEACRRANVEQGAREAMEEQMRIFDKERNKLWEQLSLSRAEMAASNEAWDSKWNEENWKRQLSEKDLQAALRTNRRLENDMQSLRVDNKALQDACTELRNSLGLATTIDKIRKTDLSKSESTIGFDGVLSRMRNIKGFVDNLETSKSRKR